MSVTGLIIQNCRDLDKHTYVAPESSTYSIRGTLPKWLLYTELKYNSDSTENAPFLWRSLAWPLSILYMLQNTCKCINNISELTVILWAQNTSTISHICYRYMSHQFQIRSAEMCGFPK